MDAEVFRFGGADRTPLRFSRLELEFAPGNRWDQARWRFDTPEGQQCFPANEVDAITATNGLFDIDLIDAVGTRRLRAESVLSDFPAGSLCFVYAEDADGWWTGHTITRSFGKIVVAYCSLDPA